MSKAKTGPELIEISNNMAVAKATAPWYKLVILGILGGAFIAFAAQGSTMAAYNLLADPATFGLGRALKGALFTVGLILVIVAGAELFTGNVLMTTGVLCKRISRPSLLRNWGIVYAANMGGAVLIAMLIHASGLWGSSEDLLGAMVIKMAAGKTALGFQSAFVLGILCNWLVCLGVWMAWSAESVGGKMAAAFFPILLFITSGFEHSIANMYYIPAGMMAKGVPEYVAKAAEVGVSAEALAGLNLHGFFVVNLIPVTLGNIVGAAAFIACAYVFAYRPKGGALGS